MTPEERLQMAKNLDTAKLIAEAEAQGETLSEHQALVALHKARYKLASLGHLKKDQMISSRRWLITNGHDLPN
jgi:hypothetical protein